MFKILWPLVIIIPWIAPISIIFLVTVIFIVLSLIIMSHYSHQKRSYLKRTDVKWWVS
ncbi:MAG: hypothetical protein PWQ18_654, partial [Clostridia bacterium]|nr:hypothetical protein [Clostridia bacterium]